MSGTVSNRNSAWYRRNDDKLLGVHLSLPKASCPLANANWPAWNSGNSSGFWPAGESPIMISMIVRRSGHPRPPRCRMIVVSNVANPQSGLIGRLDLLPQLYENAAIPGCCMANWLSRVRIFPARSKLPVHLGYHYDQ